MHCDELQHLGHNTQEDLGEHEHPDWQGLGWLDYSILDESLLLWLWYVGGEDLQITL
jgi:hypothetical protein